MLTHPCRCPACENPCNFGSGVLAGDDLKRLSDFLGLSEKETKEKHLEEIEKFNTKLLRPKLLREKGNPYGKCTFYDKLNGCTVHPAKPLECKIAMGCKEYGEELITWFDIKHFLNPKDPESLRQYKVYIESGGKVLQGAELGNFADKETIEKLSGYEDLKDDTDWDERLGIKDIMDEEKKKAKKEEKK